MKKMKKGLLSVIVIIGVFVLTACSMSAKEQKVSYEKEEKGVKIVLTYYAKGDKVTKQTSENIIPYSAMGVKSAEEPKERLKDVLKSYNDIKGVKDELTYGEDAVTEKVEIDYTVVDMKKAKELVGVSTDGGDISKGISLKNSIKLLEDQGYKEKK
ncbi:MAG: YehR family lipoprotein [Pseudolactococcus laudensis]